MKVELNIVVQVNGVRCAMTFGTVTMLELRAASWGTMWKASQDVIISITTLYNMY